MRPVRIEMEGFGAFRELTVVDFEGVDLFALTGPTGSGKTTVLDALCFALYGCIPRYDDRRLVAPAISQGRTEARVRVDFEIGGAIYTVVRVVRRTKTGASTKEARLERGGELLAAGEEVSPAVETLLGLTFEHFTTCVVLPQGEFARFLHEKPERRQELLVNLLDLRVYERMGELARSRAAAAKTAAQVHAARLDALAAATPAAEKEAAERVAALDGLLVDVELALPAIAALADAREAAEAAAEVASRQAKELAALVVPDGVDEFGARLDAADAALIGAQQAEADAEAASVAAEAALRALPVRAELERTIEASERREQFEGQREKGAVVVAERAAEAERAMAVLSEASAGQVAAAATLERLRLQHQAHAVRADLVVGEPCPVCEQLVATLPSDAAPPALEAARAALSTADAAIDQARKAHDEARLERTRVEEKLANIDRELDALADRVAGAPPRDVLATQLASVEEAEQAVAAAAAADRVARKATLQAARRREELQLEERRLRQAFDAARDGVAALDPPPRQSESLAADWADLAAWAAATAPALVAEGKVALARAKEASEAESAQLRALAEKCAVLEVEVGGNARDGVVEALTRARARHERIAEDLAEAETVRQEVSRLDDDEKLHSALARHLSARGFEKWLLDEAVALLLEGATALLLELSGGQYSLVLDDKRSGFLVVDHRNADEHRLARSLSGGETFLASLALALSLADQLALLTTKGGVRLDSMFLDEGFGTLDASTLDTVAAAIESLGTRGRMVGVITHVAELAERMPVRFEVARGVASSTVTRVDR